MKVPHPGFYCSLEVTPLDFEKVFASGHDKISTWQNIRDLLCTDLGPELELVLQGPLVPFGTSQYMCCNYSEETERIPRPKFGWNVKCQDWRHTRRGYEKFITYLMRLSGQSRVGFISWSEKQFVRAGRRLVEGFMVVRGWGWHNGLCIQAEAYVVWTSYQYQRWKHSDFLISFPRNGVKEEQWEMRL